MLTRSEGPPRRPFSFLDDSSNTGWLAAAVLSIACALLLGLAIGLGGTRGWFGDRLIQSASALMLGGVALYLALSPGRPRLSPRVWLLAGTVIAVPLLAWSGLSSPTIGNTPGALQLRADLVLAGVAQARASIGAEQVLWATFPALFILLAASLAGARARLGLLGLCVLIGIAEGMLAITQLGARGFGWVRFHWPGDVAVYLGTFANRNHLAALLFAMLPLCVAQAAVAQRDARSAPDLLRRLLWGIAAVLLVTGIVGSQSRSGLALAMLAILVTLLIVLRGKVFLKVAMGGVVAVILWLIAGGHRLVEPMMVRLLNPSGDVNRLTYLANSFDLFSNFGPGGIGFGNFQRLYGAHVGDADLTTLAVNHVHNDWAELVLETGWIGLGALAVSSVVFVRVGIELWQAWRGSERTAASIVPLAAWLGAAALAVHSMVDFPLRTTAIGCVFTLLLATAFSGPRLSGRGARRSSTAMHAPRFVQGR